jgi:D-alanine-D-alanine ligase-like ATP-grasp enzyme
VITQRQGTFEIFGFDIMLDNQLKAWLIEVNSSPSMESSTKVTSELVQEFLDSVVQLVIGEKGGADVWNEI